MNEINEKNIEKSEVLVDSDDQLSVISLIRRGKLINFKYKILTNKQNQVLKKYLKVILDGDFWRKGKGENFTNQERQLIHSIRQKIDGLPDRKKAFEKKEKEILEVKEVLEYLSSIRKGAEKPSFS